MEPLSQSLSTAREQFRGCYFLPSDTSEESARVLASRGLTLAAVRPSKLSKNESRQRTICL